MTAPEKLIALASRSIEAAMVIRRSRFDTESARFDSESVNAGAFGGSADQQAQRARCAHELHGRSGLFRDAIVAAHRDLSAEPSAPLRKAAQWWVSTQIRGEATTLRPALRQPREAFGESWSSGDLAHEAATEIRSCNAAIDAEWERVLRSRVERGWRWLVGLVRWLLRSISGGLGSWSSFRLSSY